MSIDLIHTAKWLSKVAELSDSLIYLLPLPRFSPNSTPRESSRFQCAEPSAQSLKHVQLFVAPWTAVCQSPLFMGFPRQEY